MATRIPLINEPKPSNGTSPQLVTMPIRSDRQDPKGHDVHNRILLEIPESEYAALAPHLEFVELPLRKMLLDPAEGFECGYFPDSGLISLVVFVSDGRSVEVGIVGKEGFVGAPLAAGVTETPYRAMVQAHLRAFRVKADILRVLLPDTPQLRDQLTRYAVIQGMQLSQLAACNRLHEIDQRLARWMLMCQDRLGEDLLPMTHEFFAEMLGTGRPTVSVAAAVLQRAGFIEYSRGVVKIVNREGLEGAACECFKVLQQFPF
jgi:CRP-like cAMP-binding protein